MKGKIPRFLPLAMALIVALSFLPFPALVSVITPDQQTLVADQQMVAVVTAGSGLSPPALFAIGLTLLVKLLLVVPSWQLVSRYFTRQAKQAGSTANGQCRSTIIADSATT